MATTTPIIVTVQLVIEDAQPVDQGHYGTQYGTLDNDQQDATMCIEGEKSVPPGPSDQDLIRLGFSPRQMSILRISPPDVRQEAHDTFLRMLMEDDPALEYIDELL